MWVGILRDPLRRNPQAENVSAGIGGGNIRRTKKERPVRREKLDGDGLALVANDGRSKQFSIQA